MMRKRKPGDSSVQLIAMGLVGLMVIISLFAIGKSFMQKKTQESAFEGWYENASGYEAALAEQKQSEKPLLVYIHTTWCPYCKKVNEGLMSHPEMIAYLEGYIKVRVNPEASPKEEAIMRQFHATGFPSIYIRKSPDTAYVKIPPFNNHALKTPQEFIDSLEVVIQGKGLPPEDQLKAY